MDPRRLGRGRLLRRDRRARATCWPASATRLPDAAPTSGRSTPATSTCSASAAPRVDADRGRRPPARRRRRRPRHDHLHQRHHRPAQGLRADPPQHATPTSANAIPGLPNLFHEGASTLLFLPLAHSFARLIQIGVVQARVTTAHTADIKNLVADLQGVPADVRAVACRGCSRRSTTRRKQRAHADGKGAHLRPGRARSRSPTARRWTPRRPGPRAAGCGTRSSTGWSTASCAPRWAGAATSAISGGAPLGARLGALLPRHRRHRATRGTG